MTQFDFDETIDRKSVPALKHHKHVLGSDGMNLFAAGVADMDFRVATCIQKAISHRAAHGVFGYETVPSGLMPSLVGWLQNRHGWTVDKNHILRAPNVLNTLSLSVNCFTSAGDGVIVQPPVFFDFFDIISENSREVVKSPLILQNGRYEMDFEGLERCVADPRTRMLFLCNPHNPIGRVWSRAELRQLGEICRRSGVLVVSDEIHGDITFPENAYTPFASVSEADALNSVTCLSPAKSFNIAACCTSFSLVPDDERRETLRAENSRLNVNKNNAFASVAMEAAYSEGNHWLDAALGYLAGNLELVRDCLNGLPEVDLIEPEGTFLLWLDFRGLDLAPDDLTVFLRQKAGWSITRGIAFGEEGAGFGRLNIACPKARLEAALKQLVSAVTDARKDKL